MGYKIVGLAMLHKQLPTTMLYCHITEKQRLPVQKSKSPGAIYSNLQSTRKDSLEEKSSYNIKNVIVSYQTEKNECKI